MKVLRIKLRQNKASYTREETVTNRMTYPLPPYSTIIGALHNACGYTNYKAMDISVQGKYGSMQKEIYVNHGLLNRREDDRNILAYLQNPLLLSAGYIKVGEGLKGQGNSFRKGVTVRIDNNKLYKRYIELYKIKDDLDSENLNSIKPKIIELREKEKTLKSELKKIEKTSEEYNELRKKIDKMEVEMESIKMDFENKVDEQFTKPISHYRTLAKGPKYQEVLYDVELLIHIKTDIGTIKDIKENINNLTSIGRGEDFVEVLDIKEVTLNEPNDEYSLNYGYKIYVNVGRVDLPTSEKSLETEAKPFWFADGDNVKDASGTVYYLNKNYEVCNNKRIFKKVACMYSSYLRVDENSEDILVDEDGYITDFN